MPAKQRHLHNAIHGFLLEASHVRGCAFLGECSLITEVRKSTYACSYATLLFYIKAQCISGESNETVQLYVKQKVTLSF